MDLLYKRETYNIIGAAMEVHSVLGCGFLEPVYQEAFSLELKSRNIPFEKEKQIQIIYKGTALTKYYIADFVCYNKIIVELKALSSLVSEHESQVLNYLKATELKVGLLINFGNESLEYRRFIY
jgi:GxxExxY protein